MVLCTRSKRRPKRIAGGGCLLPPPGGLLRQQIISRARVRLARRLRALGLASFGDYPRLVSRAGARDGARL